MKILGPQKPKKRETKKQFQELSAFTEILLEQRGCLFLHRYSEIREVFPLREVLFPGKFLPVFATREVLLFRWLAVS